MSKFREGMKRRGKVNLSEVCVYVLERGKEGKEAAM